MAKKSKSKKMPNEKKIPAENSAEKQSSDLSSELKSASENLIYISETDAPFEAFVWKREKRFNGQPNAEEVLKLSGQKSDAQVGEKTFDEFFEQPTQTQDWYGDEEKAQVEKFLRLKELLEKKLRETKVFRVGEVQIDIYIVGVDREGNLAGVKTKAVET